jgi:hypothetical protein
VAVRRSSSSHQPDYRAVVAVPVYAAAALPETPDREDAVGQAVPPRNSRRRQRDAEPAQTVDPRLRPFVTALAELVIADLIKYPPNGRSQ